MFIFLQKKIPQLRFPSNLNFSVFTCIMKISVTNCECKQSASFTRNTHKTLDGKIHGSHYLEGNP